MTRPERTWGRLPYQNRYKPPRRLQERYRPSSTKQSGRDRVQRLLVGQFEIRCFPSSEEYREDIRTCAKS